MASEAVNSVRGGTAVRRSDSERSIEHALKAWNWEESARRG